MTTRAHALSLIKCIKYCPKPPDSHLPNLLLLRCTVKPSPSSKRVTGITNISPASISVCVAAAPKEGEANRKICELFSELFHRPPTAVEIVGGAEEPLKTVVEIAAGAKEPLKTVALYGVTVPPGNEEAIMRGVWEVLMPVVDRELRREFNLELRRELELEKAKKEEAKEEQAKEDGGVD